MELLIAFAAGAAYTLAGIVITAVVSDLPGSRLDTLIGGSALRGCLAIILWPLAAMLGAAASHRATRRCRTERW